jgi:hypothetical protein
MQFDPQIALMGFMLLFLLYWTIHRVVEYLIRRFLPDLYEATNKPEERNRSLLPIVFMVLRILYGVFLTLPSCIYAGMTTSWELGETVNAAGAVCIASQAVPWLGEIHLQMEMNTELMLHHLFSILIVSDFILEPTFVTVKPLYLYLASQLGDGAAAMAKILRCAGFQTRKSRLLWSLRFFTASVLVWSKTVVAMYSLSRIFKDPSRLVDWFAVVCLFFFATYTLLGSYNNLLYLGLVVESEQGPRGVTLSNGIWFSRFSMTMIVATLSAVLLKPLIYALLLQHELGATEHAVAWVESIWSIVLGYSAVHGALGIWECTTLGQTLLQGGRIRQRRAELYLGFGSVAAAMAVNLTGLYGRLAQYTVLDHETVASATAATFVIWDLIMRWGLWTSIGEERRKEGSSADSVAEKGKVQEKSSDAQDFSRSQQQLRMIWADIAILSMPFIFRAHYDMSEWSYALFFSHSIVQVFNRSWAFSLRGGRGGRGDALVESKSSFKTLKMALATISVGLTLAAACRVLCQSWGCNQRQQELLWNSLGIALWAHITSWVIAIKRKPRSKAMALVLDSRPVRLLAKICRRNTLCCIVLFSFQVIGLWEAYGTDRFTRPRETSVGFKNVLEVLSSPPAILGNVVTLFFATVACMITW